MRSPATFYMLLCTHVGPLHRYDAIIDLTRKLNSKYTHPQQTQAATKRILKSLFPGWLPPAFSVSILVMHAWVHKEGRGAAWGGESVLEQGLSQLRVQGKLQPTSPVESNGVCFV